MITAYVIAAATISFCVLVACIIAIGAVAVSIKIYGANSLDTVNILRIKRMENRRAMYDMYWTQLAKTSDFANSWGIRMRYSAPGPITF
jgi:hypothetical protein